MSTTGVAMRRRPQRRVDRLASLLFPISTGLAALAIVAAASFLVGLGEDARSVITMAVTAIVFSGLAVTVWRTVGRPTAVVDAPTVFSMATVSWLALAGGAALVHAASGATATPDTAIFEGMATATTTAMTTLDPDELSRSLHFFRAGTQWMGGFGALLLAIIAVPLASRSRELTTSLGARSLNPARTGGLRRITAIYGFATLSMAVLYLVAGMGLFDAVVHALSTTATGGVSTRSGSIGAFDSAAIEWVAAVGMAVSGINIMAVWWIIQRNLGAVRRGAELRTYASVMAGSTLMLFVWLNADAGAHDALRTAFFSVASAMSTTGFITVPWNSFDSGAITVLVLLLGVGAMSGSTGGGYRYLRVIEAVRFASRELQRQLHPASVAVVKVGGRVISERSLDRMHGFTIMFVATGALGAMCIALADTSLDLTTALSMSLSALVTGGPVVGEASSPTFSELGAVSHIALAVVMLLGRLTIYPVLLAVITAFRRARVLVRAAGHVGRDR